MSNYKNEDIYDAQKVAKGKELFEQLLHVVGENPKREGILKTPMRASKAMQFLTQGYEQNAEETLLSAVFEEKQSQMVVVKDIELYSLCEHHLLPFYGKAHIAYIPNGKITGLSKLARVVDIFSRRLQVQERLTFQIRDSIQSALQPLGVAVVLEAKHMCMMMRGVQKQNSTTTTSAFSGEFEKMATRQEFFNLIKSNLS